MNIIPKRHVKVECRRRYAYTLCFKCGRSLIHSCSFIFVLCFFRFAKAKKKTKSLAVAAAAVIVGLQTKRKKRHKCITTIISCWLLCLCEHMSLCVHACIVCICIYVIVQYINLVIVFMCFFLFLSVVQLISTENNCCNLHRTTNCNSFIWMFDAQLCVYLDYV